jgi:CRP-like cAMP-binding protein
VRYLPWPETVRLYRLPLERDKQEHGALEEQISTRPGGLMDNPLILNLEKRDRLSAEEKALLSEALSETQAFVRHEDLVREGSEPTYSSLLINGFAARYKLLANGRRQLTAIHVVGDFIDLHSFLLKPMDHSVVALTSGAIAKVPHNKLKSISETSAHLARLLWLSTLIDAAIHREWIASIGGRTAKSRLAHLLCELFLRLEAVGKTDGGSFDLPLTQTEIAEAHGLSLVHINRSIRALRATGAFQWKGGRVVIENWKLLQEIGDFNPVYLNLKRKPR